jgi:uncharacterized protein YegL
MEAAKGVNVFAVGVGNSVDFTELKKLSAKHEPFRLKGLSFVELFQWLSSSLSKVGDSALPALTDDGNTPDEMLALPPAVWVAL